LASHGLDLAEFGNVAEDLNGRATVTLDGGQHQAERRRVSAVHRHLGSLSREKPRNRGSNAA
jgi:hypothetical protein